MRQYAHESLISRLGNIAMQSHLRSRLVLWRAARPEPAALAAASLTPAAVRTGLRLSILEGALTNVHVSLTIGAFTTGLALLLGASDLELGLIGAMPFVGPLFQFVGAYLEERVGERRRIAVWSSAISRVLWAVMAALPFLTVLEHARLPLFLALLLVSQALLGIALNAWTSWMSDLVPARRRGRFFGTRNTVASVSAMITTWLAGWALDYYHGIGNERAGYALIFGVAALCAVAASIVLNHQPEPLIQRQRLSIRALFSQPLRNHVFRTFSFAATGWAVVTGVAAPFFNAYGIQTLGLPFTTLALFGVATSTAALFTQPFVGRLQDRYGNKTVLIASAIGTALLPWGWVLSTPTFLLPLWCTSTLAGVFWPGITQGLINLLMERAPAEGRGAYVAVYGTVTGAGTCVAGVLGGLLASALGSTVITLGALSLGHYAVLFVLTSVGRAFMAWVFARWL